MTDIDLKARVAELEAALEFYADGAENSGIDTSSRAWVRGLNSVGLGCRYPSEALQQDQGGLAASALRTPTPKHDSSTPAPAEGRVEAEVRLLPVVATEAMNFAGQQVGDYPWDGKRPSRIWAAMVAAAPQPPTVAREDAQPATDTCKLEPVTLRDAPGHYSSEHAETWAAGYNQCLSRSALTPRTGEP